MKETILGILFIGLLFVLPGCGDSGSSKGACVSSLGTLRQCANDVNAQQCSWLNGTLHTGKTCDELGFKSG